MAVTDSELSSKGREVENKFVDKWIEEEIPLLYALDDGGECRAAVEEGFAGTKELFESWNGRDPAGLQGMRDHLQNTVLTFGNIVMADLDTVKGQLSDWRGTAAGDFGTWLGRLDQVTANQVNLIMALEKALEMTQALSEGSRDEVIAIGDQTIAVLEALEDNDDGGFGFGMALLAVVAGVAAGIATGGVGGVLTIMAASASFAGAVGAEVQRQNAQIRGDDVLEVFGSMAECLDSLWVVYNEVSQSIADAITADQTRVDDLREWYRQPRPELISLDVSGGITPEVEDAFEPPRS